MAKRRRKSAVRSRDAPTMHTEEKKNGWVSLCTEETYKILCGDGYRPLSQCPEVIMAVDAYADIIASMTIHLMQNTEKGDKRVKNALSRRMDIEPNPYMTRYQLMHTIVHTMMLEGEGNQVTIPTYDASGLLVRLDPAPPSKVQFVPPKGNRGYRIRVGGAEYDPDEVLHFVVNPDPEEPWRGRGYKVGLRDVVKSIRQATATKNALMESPMPSIIVKVDGLTEDLQTPEGRDRISNQYLTKTENGKPWMIPADTLEVTQVKPLTLNDLAIKTSLELDKKSIAALLKVPAFLVGAGNFDAKEYDWFVSVPCIKPAKIIEQELTRKLLYAPDLFWRLNNRSLLNYDVERIANVGKEMVDRAAMRRNEWRDWMGFPPDEDMDDLLILENYIRRNKLEAEKLEGGEGNAEGAV